jgi:Protein of unknown function (DUF4199)
MKNITLKYGTIAGLLMTAVILVFLPLSPKIGFYNANTLVFIGKLIAFIPIYFGMGALRETYENGYMKYMQALPVGLFITVIVCLFYAISTVLVYFVISPDLPDKVASYILDTMKSQGAAASDISEFQSRIMEAKSTPKSPIVIGAIAVVEILPYGLILSLIFAAITKKNPPKLELGS